MRIIRSERMMRRKSMWFAHTTSWKNKR